MKVLLLVISGAIAYILGGVNGSILISKLIYRRDIRNYGSGNAGLTNFFRTFGSVSTLLVVGIDILKSVVAVFLGGWLLGRYDAAVLGKLFSGFCLIMGHMYPIFHQFRGGKGVLCGVIMATVVDWRVGMACFGAFLIVVVCTRYVSLGSMIGALVCPVMLLALGYAPLEAVLGLLCALVIVVKHAENILRLIRGQERRLSFHRKEAAKDPTKAPKKGPARANQARTTKRIPTAPAPKRQARQHL